MGAKKGFRSGFFEDHHIIRYQPVASADQGMGGFAFADAGLAAEQNADAGHVHTDTVYRHLRRHQLAQIRIGQLLELLGAQRCAQKRNILLLAVFDQILQPLLVPCNHEAGRMVLDDIADPDIPFLFRQRM
ncbi:hypothetical protein D3C76_1151750 [compost metagenome]